MNKLVRSVDVIRAATSWRRDPPMTIVLCHGCFDYLHPGHVRHLKWASEQGDWLVVSVTGDRYVKKGAGRPFVAAEHRAELLACLEMVDSVVITEADEPSALIRQLRPDVYVKGWEYHRLKLPEMDALKQIGAKMMFSPDDVVYSSTALGHAAS